MSNSVPLTPTAQRWSIAERQRRLGLLGPGNRGVVAGQALVGRVDVRAALELLRVVGASFARGQSERQGDKPDRSHVSSSRDRGRVYAFFGLSQIKRRRAAGE
jgi:hypothetical protein